MNKVTMTLFSLLMFNIQFVSASSLEKFKIIKRTNNSVVWGGHHEGKVITITKKPSADIDEEGFCDVVVATEEEDILVGHYGCKRIVNASFLNETSSIGRSHRGDTSSITLLTSLIKTFNIDLKEPYKID